MQKVRLTVSGMVQGVGFRYMTKQVANRMNVYGTVKNDATGSVIITAYAPEETMNRFIKKIKASPTPAGIVTSVSITYDDSLPTYQSFDIIN